MAIHIEWQINGTSLNNLQLSNVVQGFEPISGVGTLRFSNVPVEYNNTVVQCTVNTSSQGQMASGNSMLLIQGNTLQNYNVLTSKKLVHRFALRCWVSECHGY
jgi:hypothetical protein